MSPVCGPPGSVSPDLYMVLSYTSLIASTIAGLLFALGVLRLAGSLSESS